MPQLLVNYYAYGRRGRRHSASPVINIAPQLNSSPINGTPANVNAFDITGFPTFAFWSITGEDGGGRVSRNRFETVTAASNPLAATAWYLPQGGPNDPHDGELGIGIDAFDVDRGNFIDDDFVTVAPDGGLTAAANWDGWVPTANAETITAFNPIHNVATARNIPFDSWMEIDPPAPAVGAALSPPVGSNGTALAMYRTPAPPHYGRPDFHDTLVWTLILGGVFWDGGGLEGGPGRPLGPVDPWGPMIARLSTETKAAIRGLLLHEAASGLGHEAAATELGRIGLHQAADAIKQLGAMGQKGL